MPDRRWAELVRTLRLGEPEAVVPGYLGRSPVGLFADSVLKLYRYQPAVKKPREARALRRWSGSGVTPELIDEGADWVRMSRVEGRPLAEVAEARRSLDVARQVGGLLGALHAVGPAESLAPASMVRPDLCRAVYYHGNFSARNIMVAPAAEGFRVTGVIDFEKSETACFAGDLVSQWIHVAVEREPTWPAFVEAYRQAYALEQGLDLGREHLFAHVGVYLAWVLRWAPTDDPAFAREVVDAVGRLLRKT